MAVRLRLRRMGKKKQPFYRIVAIDSRVSRNGKYLDKIGHYNPLIDPPEIVVDEVKALLWLNRGAIPSDTVKSLLSRKGVLLKWDLTKKGFDPTRIEEEMKRWEVLQVEREKRRQAALQEKMEKATPKTETEAEVETEVKAETEATVEVETKTGEEKPSEPAVTEAPSAEAASAEAPTPPEEKIEEAEQP